jgi:hypothetical protein
MIEKFKESFNKFLIRVFGQQNKSKTTIINEYAVVLELFHL